MLIAGLREQLKETQITVTSLYRKIKKSQNEIENLQDQVLSLEKVRDAARKEEEEIGKGNLPKEILPKFSRSCKVCNRKGKIFRFLKPSCHRYYAGFLGQPLVVC